MNCANKLKLFVMLDVDNGSVVVHGWWLPLGEQRTVLSGLCLCQECGIRFDSGTVANHFVSRVEMPSQDSGQPDFRKRKRRFWKTCATVSFAKFSSTAFQCSVASSHFSSRYAANADSVSCANRTSSQGVKIPMPSCLPLTRTASTWRKLIYAGLSRNFHSADNGLWPHPPLYDRIQWNAV